MDGEWKFFRSRTFNERARPSTINSPRHRCQALARQLQARFQTFKLSIPLEFSGVEEVISETELRKFDVRLATAAPSLKCWLTHSRKAVMETWRVTSGCKWKTIFVVMLWTWWGFTTIFELDLMRIELDSSQLIGIIPAIWVVGWLAIPQILFRLCKLICLEKKFCTRYQSDTGTSFYLESVSDSFGFSWVLHESWKLFPTLCSDRWNFGRCVLRFGFLGTISFSPFCKRSW